MNTNFLDSLIAQWLDKFKIANPKTWGVVALILFAIEYILNNGATLGVFSLNSFWANILQYISWAVTLLVGARTTRHLPNT